MTTKNEHTIRTKKKQKKQKNEKTVILNRLKHELFDFQVQNIV